MGSTPHIRILMCTLNGAAYLPAQLESFLAQTHRDWSLWISDDGSDDGTLTILTRFQAKNADRDVQIFHGPEQGAAQNYFSLLGRVDPDPDMLVALSDQDDIWLPDKLARAAAAIAGQAGQRGQKPDGGPIAYGAAQTIVDHELGKRRRSRPWPAGPSFRNALVQNILSGSSLVLNHPALDLVQRTLPQGEVPFHDWWIYQLITGAGGHAIADPTSALLYRQHRDNVLGGNRGWRALGRRGVMIWRGEFARWISANAAGLRATGALTPENEALLARFSDELGRAGPRRVWRLHRMGIRRQTLVGTVMLYLMAAAGRL